VPFSASSVFSPQKVTPSPRGREWGPPSAYLGREKGKRIGPRPLLTGAPGAPNKPVALAPGGGDPANDVGMRAIPPCLFFLPGCWGEGGGDARWDDYATYPSESVTCVMDFFSSDPKLAVLRRVESDPVLLLITTHALIRPPIGSQCPHAARPPPCVRRGARPALPAISPGGRTHRVLRPHRDRGRQDPRPARAPSGSQPTNPPMFIPPPPAIVPTLLSQREGGGVVVLIIITQEVSPRGNWLLIIFFMAYSCQFGPLRLPR